MTAFAYAALTLPAPPLETYIERVWTANHAALRGAQQLGAHEFQGWLADLKGMRHEGWDVTVLVAPGYTIVALACRGGSW